VGFQNNVVQDFPDASFKAFVHVATISLLAVARPRNGDCFDEESICYLEGLLPCSGEHIAVEVRGPVNNSGVLDVHRASIPA